VGLPAAGQGFELVADLLHRLHPPHVLIVSDLDEPKSILNGDVKFPGMESALKLCERFMQSIPDLHFLLPPDGVKDLRAWLRESGPDAIRAAVEKSPKVHRAWLNGVWREYHHNQEMCRTPDWAKQAAALLANIEDDEQRAGLRYRFEERAGICEHEAGLPRDEAERIAFEELHAAVLEISP